MEHPSPRKLIQIAVASRSEGSLYQKVDLYGLADDGTAWKYDGRDWNRLGDLPEEG